MIYDIKEGKAYIAKASLVNLGNTSKQGVFFKTDATKFLEIIDKLYKKELEKRSESPTGAYIEFTVLPLNHDSDKYSHSVKININLDYYE